MMYSVYKMNRIEGNCSFQNIDGFIFFATPEERSLSVAKKMKRMDILPKQVVALTIENTPFCKDEKTFENTDVIKSSMEANLYSSLILNLKDIHKYISSKKIIGIDISVMPTPVFAQILHFIIKRHAETRIIVYYTEPIYYSLENLFDYITLDGEIEIKAIPGYEGKTSQDNEVQRVIFYMLGFETNGLNKLIPQVVNPDYIVPINGFPSYFPKYKDISIINNNANYHEIDIKMAFSSANNPFEAYNKMSELKNRYDQCCIDIIPAGSKPMALGACLFALKGGDNDVRLLFPFPSEHISRQSVGCGTVWEYIID